MNSVKLNKKLLFSILLTLVLLFSLNLNTFASSSIVLDFYNQPFSVTSSNGDITSKVIISESTYNELHYTKYTFPAGTTYSKAVIVATQDIPFYMDTTYNYTFYTESSFADYTLNVLLVLTDANNEFVEDYVLVNGTFPNNSSSSDGSYVINEHTGSVHIEPNNNVKYYSILVTIGDDSNSYYASNLFLYDMTFTATGPLYGEPITPADTSGLTAIMGDYDNIVDSLPSVEDYDTDTLFDVNVDSYTSAMSFSKSMFDNVLQLSGMNSVLIFALCIGLATYIVGRKVG